MTPKQLIILVLALSFGFVLIMGAFWGVYKYYPTYLGLPSNPKDTVAVKEEPIYIEPHIVLSRAEFDKLQAQLLLVDILKIHNDSLRKIKDRLWDSMKAMDKNISQWKDSVIEVHDTISQKDKFSKLLLDSIETLRNQTKKSSHETKLVQQHIKDLEEMLANRYDSLEVKNFETFAKIYNSANPSDVAKILEQIDDRDAAKILKLMQKKKAGKVLEAMLPEQAAAILIIGID